MPSLFSRYSRSVTGVADRWATQSEWHTYSRRTRIIASVLLPSIALALFIGMTMLLTGPDDGSAWPPMMLVALWVAAILAVIPHNYREAMKWMLLTIPVVTVGFVLVAWVAYQVMH